MSENNMPSTPDPESQGEETGQPTHTHQQESAEEAESTDQPGNKRLARTKFPIVVVLLLVINALIWGLTKLAGSSTETPVLSHFGVQLNSAVVNGQYWRLVSGMFLHIGFEHLLFNCLALLLLGKALESLYGRYRFLAIYVISGYLGNLLFLAFGPKHVISAGASGAVFGILGVHITLNLLLKPSSFLADRQQLVASIVYILWIFLRSASAGIHILTNFGGILAGVALGVLLRPEYLRTDASDAVPRDGIGKDAPRWVWKSGLVLVILIGLTVASVLWSSDMSAPYAKVLEFNGTQLFYTPSVTEHEAKGLGKYLVDSGFADGNPKTVHLSKSEETYYCRMVAKEKATQHLAFLALSQRMAIEMSRDLFDQARVEIHLCDENLETIMAIPTPNTYLTQVHLNQGMTSLGEGKLGEAAVAFQKAIRVDPSLVLAYNNLGFIHLRQGKLDAAIAAYQKSIAIDSSNPTTYFGLGLVYQARGYLDDAIAAYKTAISIKPDNPATHYNLARAYALQNAQLLSIESLQEAARLNKDRNEMFRIELDFMVTDFDSIRENPAFQEFVNSSK